MITVRLLSRTQPADYVGSSDERFAEIEGCPHRGQFSFFCISFEPIFEPPSWLSGMAWLLTPNNQLLVGATALTWCNTITSRLTEDASGETRDCLGPAYGILQDYGHTPRGNKFDTLDGFVLR